MKIEKICKNCGKIRYFYPAEIKIRPLNYCKDCRRFSGRTHGESHSRLYSLWNSMNMRCTQPSDTNYIRYGAKGISVCNEWKSYINFRDWALQNGYTEKLSIDRKENSKGYFPENCRWATKKEQVRNMTTNKLTMEKANEIRELYKTKLYTHKQIALKYNIHPTMVGYITRNKHWV